MSTAGLAGPVGFDAADDLGGGPPEGAHIAAVQVDGDGVLGDVNGDDAPGVDPPESDLLPDHHDDAGVAGAPLGGDGRFAQTLDPVTAPWRAGRRQTG